MQGYYILKTKGMKENDVFLYFLKYVIASIIKKKKKKLNCVEIFHFSSRHILLWITIVKLYFYLLVT